MFGLDPDQQPVRYNKRPISQTRALLCMCGIVIFGAVAVLWVSVLPLHATNGLGGGFAQGFFIVYLIVGTVIAAILGAILLFFGLRR